MIRTHRFSEMDNNLRTRVCWSSLPYVGLQTLQVCMIQISIHPLIHQSINPSNRFIRPSTHRLIHSSADSSINPSIYKSLLPSMHLTIDLSIHTSIHPSIHPLIYQSIHQLIRPIYPTLEHSPTHPSLPLSIHRSIRPPIPHSLTLALTHPSFCTHNILIFLCFPLNVAPSQPPYPRAETNNSPSLI